MAGIFISKGMTVTIPAGGLKISLGPDGPSIPSVTLHVHFDVCPTWCELAMTHLASANSHEAARVLAWQGTDENEKAKSLEREFESSMQAVMAAAIAIDAFHAVVRGHVQIPPELVDKWRVRRTARYSQVTEVLRRGFHLKPKGTKALRDNLKEIYRFRDMAVHPSGRIQAALLHPDLDVGVEWRFVYFRASNARALVNAATGIVWQLAHHGKPTTAKVVNYINGLRARLAMLFPSGHPESRS